MQYIFDIKQHIIYNLYMKDIEITNKVKLARIEKGLTQEQLADYVGVTRQTIGLIEVGKYNPTIKLCILLCQATGKKLDELFWQEGEPNV